MQTINTPNRRTSSRSASWRRRRCATQSARLPHLAQRPPVSVSLASAASALAPLAFAGLFLLAGSLTSAPLAQTHAAASSLSTATTAVGSAVDLAAFSDMADMQAQATAQAHSATTLRYQRGYSVQGNWLCYGWANGAYHCTQHWYRASSGAYVSLNPSWVASQASAGGAGVTVTSFAEAVSAKPANAYPFGECTYGAEALAHDNLNGLGNARDWLANARARGLPTGTTPRVGATVTFQPGVQGASWLGHVGHVVALGANGAFEMEAMNDDAGFGRYAYRWVHVGAGVAFIY